MVFLFKLNLLGQMAENIMATGKMESNTEKESFIIFRMPNGKKESGMMEKELDGLMTLLSNKSLFFYNKIFF